MQPIEQPKNVINTFARYVLQGRRQAIMMALACALLPFMGWLAAVVLCLVTLRQGTKEGFLVLLWVVLPSVVVGLTLAPELLWDNVVFGCLLTWVLAVVLRHTAAWSRVIEVATIVAMLGILIAHGVFDDIQQFWLQYLMQRYTQFSQLLQLDITPADTKLLLQHMAAYLTGLQAAVLMMGNLCNLALARGLQSRLFNAGGLRKELCNLRLNGLAAISIAVVLLLYFTQMNLLRDLLPVIIIPFFLAGLSVMHYFAMVAKITWPWLISFYSLLILFFPYMLAVIVACAVADICFNFRRRGFPKFAIR